MHVRQKGAGSFVNLPLFYSSFINDLETPERQIIFLYSLIEILFK